LLTWRFYPLERGELDNAAINQWISLFLNIFFYFTQSLCIPVFIPAIKGLIFIQETRGT